MASEIELKLELTPDAVARIVEAPLLGPAQRTVRQVSTYHDTPDLLLSRSGFSLRIRKTPDGLVQTIKGPGESPSLLMRSEWERPVESEHPDKGDIAGLLGVDPSALRLGPLFTVVVERQLWYVEEPEGRIEVALDQGEIIAGDRHLPLAELELELKSGEEHVLFALARRLLAIAPFRIGVTSKAEKGFLLRDRLLSHRKPEAWQPDPDIAAAAAFRGLALSCVAHFRENEDIYLQLAAPEALHQMRVALRRLRSLISVCRPFLATADAGRFAEEFRWLAGSLARARSLDVLSTRPDRLAAGAASEEARLSAHAAAGAALASMRALDLMLDFNAWLQCGRFLGTGADPRADEPLRDFAPRALARLRRRLRKRSRSFSDLSDAERHEVRKAVKRLRYVAEFFQPAFRSARAERRYRRFALAMEALQDHLGVLNDHATLEPLAEPDADPQRAGKAGAERARLLRRAEAALEAVLAAKPFWK